MADIQYQILRADKEGMPPLDGTVYTDPEKAANDARVISRQMNEKLIVKPIINNKWREREELRVRRGEYRQLPWAGQPFWHHPTVVAIWKDQYPHPSIEKPGWLAYTKNAEDGMKDKQTVVRPGAYLKRYFEDMMRHYGCSERRLVEQFMLAYGPIEIKFAATEEEIIAVYERGPETCMRGRHWPPQSNHKNPALIYAAGDLQVAYLGSLEKATARTLVWPERKIFSRVYGDIARLTSGLERLGYKWGAPIGAKLKRIPVQEVKFDPRQGIPSHCFVAPYIDKKNQAGGGHLSVMDKGDHLVICEEGVPGSHHCGLADGYSGQYIPREDEYPTYTCDRCGKPGFRQLHTVIEDIEEGTELAWCDRCAVHHSFICGYSGSRFDKEAIERVAVEGNYWAKYYADMYAAKCEVTGRLCNKDHMYRVFVEGKQRLVSAQWGQEAGGIFRSDITRNTYLKRDRVGINSAWDGHLYVGRPELKYHAFQCEECDNHWRLQDRNEVDGKLVCNWCQENKANDDSPNPFRKIKKPKQSLYHEIKWEVPKEPF